jgi:hypothetical protein
MSMNLYCDEVELWQTPTYITYMCYSNEDGGWKGILYRYIEWVKDHTNGVWKDDQLDKYKEITDSVNEHIKELNTAAKLYGRLTFSVG